MATWQRPARRAMVAVDGGKSCPLLLRTFIKHGAHHKAEDYATRGSEPSTEIHLHTWMDATLRELSDMIKQSVPEARMRGSRISFAIVYPDKRGVLVVKEVGSTHALRRGPYDEKNLTELHFQAGDFMDVAIIGSMAMRDS